MVNPNIGSLQQDIIIAYGSHTPALSVQDATYNLQDRPSDDRFGDHGLTANQPFLSII